MESTASYSTQPLSAMPPAIICCGRTLRWWSCGTGWEAVCLFCRSIYYPAGEEEKSGAGEVPAPADSIDTL